MPEKFVNATYFACVIMYVVRKIKVIWKTKSMKHKRNDKSQSLNYHSITSIQCERRGISNVVHFERHDFQIVEQHFINDIFVKTTCCFVIVDESNWVTLRLYPKDIGMGKLWGNVLPIHNLSRVCVKSGCE